MAKSRVGAAGESGQCTRGARKASGFFIVVGTAAARPWVLASKQALLSAHGCRCRCTLALHRGPNCARTKHTSRNASVPATPCKEPPISYASLSAPCLPLSPASVALPQDCFQKQYSVIHRLETNKLRNVSCLFAHLLATDALPWSALTAIRLTEEDTTSSSRIFIKYLFQVRVKPQRQANRWGVGEGRGAMPGATGGRAG